MCLISYIQLCLYIYSEIITSEDFDYVRWLSKRYVLTAAGAVSGNRSIAIKGALSSGSDLAVRKLSSPGSSPILHGSTSNFTITPQSISGRLSLFH